MHIYIYTHASIYTYQYISIYSHILSHIYIYTLYFLWGGAMSHDAVLFASPVHPAAYFLTFDQPSSVTEVSWRPNLQPWRKD